MAIDIIILSQKENDKYHMISLICGISNKTQMNLSMKQTDSQTERINLWLPRGWGGMDWEFGISRCKLLYRGWINKVLMCRAQGTLFSLP